MSSLLLVPYNDSMRLGQGYNSFLQTPCVHNAVEVGDHEDPIVDVQNSVSQVVSYSSRFVSRISEVVRSMNISAGTAIKNGSIVVSGNSLNVDEMKFTASDLNAVVSVKVVNQQTQLQDDAKFVIPSFALNSEKFHDLYGDCYISGFIEGGDLHGIVSIKALDSSKREKIKAILKGNINGADPGNNAEFTLSKGTGSSSIAAALKETETTISVNWSGGGQIKAATEEWSLETLLRVAAGFPARVATCPQRTYAILTKYDTNLNFLAYASQNRIRIREYSIAQRYTSDLLDMYMEYKNNLAILQNVLSNPSAYRVSSVSGALNISTSELVVERKKMKDEMELIVDQIDAINRRPYKARELEDTSKIEPPEVWATKLPILKEDVQSDSLSFSMESLMQAFPLAGPPPSSAQPAVVSSGAPKSAEIIDQVKKGMNKVKEVVQEVPNTLPKPQANPFEPPPPPLLYDNATIGPHLISSERDFLSLENHRSLYANYRFGRPIGNTEDGDFNFIDCDTLQKSSIPASWPTRIEIQMVYWEEPNSIIGFIKVTYDQLQLTNGSNRGRLVSTLVLDLAPGEKVCKIRMSKGKRVWNVNGVSFIELITTSGTRRSIGSEDPSETVESIPYDGAVGLKGFFGRRGDVIDRVGPIWGK